MMTNAKRRRLWRVRVADYRASDLSVKQWCESNGVTDKQLRYWLGKINVPEGERICAACGGPMHEMSSQTREELEIIPAQVRLIRHVRYVYGCRRCDRNCDEVPIVTA